MREEKINRHRVVFYDSIEDLPISRFHKYSKYMLIASGIGDSVVDIDEHIERIMDLISTDTEKAKRELMNMRHNLVMVLNEQDIRHVGFMYFVYSVDDKKWEDFSESGVQKLYEMMQDAREIDLARAEKVIRERIDTELKDYFPDVFQGENRNILDALHKRALLQIDEVLNDTDHSPEIVKYDEYINKGYKPLNFDGAESVELTYDKQFEQMCLAISKEFGGMAKGYSVMEYYTAYERLEQINKEFERIRRK